MPCIQVLEVGVELGRQRDVGRGAAHLAELVGPEGRACQEIEVVLLLELAGVVGRVFPLESLEVARSLRDIVAQVLGGRVEFVGGGEASVVPPVQVVTEVGFQGQAVHEFSLEEDVPQDLVRLAVAVDQPKAAQRVDVFLLDPGRLRKAVLRFFVVHRGQWIVGECVGLGAAKGAVGADVVVVGPVDVQVLPDGQEVLVLLGRVVTHGVARVVGFLPADDPVLVPVVDGQERVLRRGGDSMVDHRGRVEDFIHPVGVRAQGVAGVREPEQVECGGLVAVRVLLSNQGDVILGIEHLRQAPWTGVQVARGVSDHTFVGGTSTLGGDDDDAVGRTRAVNGTGGRVLQHVDGLDVAGVQVVDVPHLQSVHHKQRGVVSVGADAADEDGFACAGLP